MFHPKTSPGSLPAPNIPQKEQAALQAALPTSERPSGKARVPPTGFPLAPNSLHSSVKPVQRCSSPLPKPIPNLLRPWRETPEVAAGKQRCREGGGRVTSELGTSPGWVQGHEHHCRMSPEVRVVLGTGSLLDAQAALATTVKSQLSPHLIPSKTAADGKHRKTAALDLDSSLPLTVPAPGVSHAPRDSKLPQSREGRK